MLLLHSSSSGTQQQHPSSTAVLQVVPAAGAGPSGASSSWCPHSTPQHNNATTHAPQAALLQPFAAATPAAQHQHKQQQPPTTAFFSSLLAQLDALGWGSVQSLSPDLSLVALQLLDAAGRHHVAHLHLQPATFPVSAPAVVLGQLPAPFKTRWRPGDTLAALVAQMQQVLESYQSLWEQLEDLDAHTQLLDAPAALAKPYSTCSRCVSLGNGASCQLRLAPGAPTALPSSVVFQGPSSVVAGLQSSWYGGAHRLWNEGQCVRANLEAVLQLELPPPKPGVRKGCATVAAAGAAVTPDGLQQGLLLSAAGDSSNSGSGSDDEEGGLAPGACAICYALHLPDPNRPQEPGAAPSVSCSAALCGRPFHAACLAEWLASLPDSRRVFDTLFGACPFCQQPIGVSTRAVAA